MRLYPSTKHFRIYEQSLKGKRFLSGKYSLKDSMIHFKFYPVDKISEVNGLDLGDPMEYQSQNFSSVEQDALSFEIGTKWRPIDKVKVNVIRDGTPIQSYFTDTLGKLVIPHMNEYDAITISHSKYQSAYIPLTFLDGNHLKVTLKKINYNRSIGPLNASYINMSSDTLKTIYSYQSHFTLQDIDAKKKKKKKKIEKNTTEQLVN